MRTALLIALLVFVPSLAGAQPMPVRVDKGDLASQRQMVVKEFREGGRYAEIAPEAQAEVSAALDRMEAHIESAGSVEALDAEARVEVFNDQELVNNLLLEAAADSRSVCTREVRTGSHRRTVNCMTVAERRRLESQSKDALRRVRPNPLPAGN